MPSPMSVIRHTACLLALSIPLIASADDDHGNDKRGHQQPYEVQGLVSDSGAEAAFPDANLVNSWGVAFNPNGFVWVADNATGKSTLYDGEGHPQSLVVSIPPAPKGGEPFGKPTGILFNASADFVVTNGTTSGPGVFIFASEDGGISAWSPTVDGTHALIAVDNSPAGAIYKGIALAGNGSARHLYATDFHNRRVDVFDTQFKPVVRDGAFEDPYIPRHFAPFGIQNVNGDLYVTYAKQDEDAEDDVAGPGLGFVDVFDADGKLIQRLAARGALNAPWGIAIAPRSFGSLGGAVLVGNFGDGTINAYGLHGGAFLGTLRDKHGRPLRIDGLWGISFGNGLFGQPTNALFFAAGPEDESHGLYGVVRPVRR